MNDLTRKNIEFPKITVNTKFLNCLQPEWLKCVTQVRLAKRLTKDSYDNLFDYLYQYKKLVNASRAKKLEKSHDPLALVAHTGSSSRPPSAYYVTHPPSVVNYDNDYQGDAFQNNYEDPLTSKMMLLARTITQRFSNPTKNRLCTSSNTITKQLCKLTEMMLGTHRELFEVRLQDMLQMFNAIISMRKDEAGVTLTDEQNDFLVADATRMEEIEELSTNICLMAIIQPTNIDSDAWLSYDSAFLNKGAFDLGPAPLKGAFVANSHRGWVGVRVQPTHGALGCCLTTTGSVWLVTEIPPRACLVWDRGARIRVRLFVQRRLGCVWDGCSTAKGAFWLRLLGGSKKDTRGVFGSAIITAGVGLGLAARGLWL
ncbi:hypothetical protein Tco_0566310 [Tanacetum coccineum]